jgi:ubiquinol-cytochrome c reductase cytochrome c subunit
MRRLFMRWLTRRARTPRWIRLAMALVLGALALISIANPAPSPASNRLPGGPPTSLPNAPAKSPEPQPPGAPTTTFPTSPQLVAKGMSLYEEGCASCHGALLQGIPHNAPSLIGVGAGPVDFYLSTGRMPLDNPSDQPLRNTPRYTRAEMNALIAFITKVGGGPPAPAADPSQGDLAVGLHVFTLHCAGCHQIVARGGLVVGAVVPALQQSTALQVAEAVRMGPYLMPHFDARQINQQQLNSVARYVLWTRHPANYGGWGIYNIGPIPEGMAAWFIGLAALVLVARLIGERMETE